MSQLQISGTYITRNGRQAILKSSESRPFQPTPGHSETKEVFKGDLMRSDGKSVDSEHEWIDTLRVGVLGEHVNQNSSFQTASEYDLIQRVA